MLRAPSASCLERSWPVFAVVAMHAIASGQTEVGSWRGRSSMPNLGNAVAFVGDVDGDGVSDYVAGGSGLLSTPWYGTPGHGRALLFSGADGSTLGDRWGPLGAEFGAAVARAGDVDGDGTPDVAVGAPADGDGTVQLLSGRDFSVLRTLAGTSAKSRFGAALASLGDLDGDGVDELAIGAPLHDVGGSPLGQVVLVSGASGSVLHQWTGSSAWGTFGSVVADGGDVDADGTHDLLVVQQQDTTQGADVGSLSVISGTTRSLLQLVVLAGRDSDWTAAAAGDVDGDGAGDVIVGNKWHPNGYLPYPPYDVYFGGIWVHSVAKSAQLHALWGAAAMGFSACPAGDVDGDGFDDFAYGRFDVGIRLRVEIASGLTGRPLQSLDDLTAVDDFSGMGMTLAFGEDVDGDGRKDLLVASPYNPTTGPYAGSVAIYELAGANLLRDSTVDVDVDFLGASSALLDDLDGDGTRDLLVGEGAPLDGFANRQITTAIVRSGADGSELRRHEGPARGDQYARSIASLPDVDRDAIGDYAIGFPGISPPATGVVEIRSGASGALVSTLSSPNGSGGFGVSLAVAIQPSGNVELAVGQTGDPNSRGEVAVFDVASGTLVVERLGAADGDFLGTSVAHLGDVNGDGVGDWAAGAPRPLGGAFPNVVVFSGKDGALLKQLLESGNSSFGASVAGPGDLDGDGVPDLLVGAPNAGTMHQGRVQAWSGRTWKVLRRWDGESAYDECGAAIAVVPDVNDDGKAEIAFCARKWFESVGSVELRSGGSGGLLYRFEGARFGDRFGSALLAARPGDASDFDGDAIADLGIGAPHDDASGTDAGRLSLFALDDLFLQAGPTELAVGVPVEVATRGGPAGNLAALFVVAIDGVPAMLLAGVGVFDAEGVWSLAATTPAGLSGHVLTLRAFAISFRGAVVDSRDVALTFL